MARSSYVYVMVGYRGDPVAAFTVKHEAQTWLRRRSADVAQPPIVQVMRMADGGNSSDANYIWQPSSFLDG